MQTNITVEQNLNFITEGMRFVGRFGYDTNANYRRTNYRMNVDMDITKTTLLKIGVSGALSKRNSPGLGDFMVWAELFGYNEMCIRDRH